MLFVPKDLQHQLYTKTEKEKELRAMISDFMRRLLRRPVPRNAKLRLVFLLIVFRFNPFHFSVIGTVLIVHNIRQTLLSKVPFFFNQRRFYGMTKELGPDMQIQFRRKRMIS